VKQTVKLKFPTRSRFRQSLALAGALALAGCSSNLNGLGDPAATGGTSTVSQARPPDAPPPVYPAVHDMPPPRNSVVLTDYEQKKLENDLASARRKVSPDPEKAGAKGAAKGAAKATKSAEKSTEKGADKSADKDAAPQKTGNKQDP
jgi:hypothetical protein